MKYLCAIIKIILLPFHLHKMPNRPQFIDDEKRNYQILLSFQNEIRLRTYGWGNGCVMAFMGSVKNRVMQCVYVCANNIRHIYLFLQK